MTVPSVPVVFGDREYRLRFSQQDLLSIEEKLGPVFQLFTPEKMGVKTACVLVWRGLYYEAQKSGELVHVFSLSPKGLDEAAGFVEKYIQEDGGTYFELFDKIAPGMMAALGVKSATNEPAPEPRDVDQKNLRRSSASLR